MKEGKASDAAVIMEKMVMSRYGTAKEELLFLKAKVMDAAGNTDKAYQSLIISYAKEPTSLLEKEIIGYGSKLGKDAMQVNKRCVVYKRYGI